ncbi:MAG: transcription termination/antitermination protein NusA [Flavobacteriaceae bacterium]|nr:transcription termination/antitermination protein NusA [Flavobacteriaceae bacterium]
MHSEGLVESFSEFKELKNIDRATMIRVVEDVFKQMIKKKYFNDENFDVIINDQSGDLEIYRSRVVVDDDDCYSTASEIELTEARKIDPDLNVGDDCIEEMPLEIFGRRAVLTARQTLMGRIMELEKDELYKKYKDRVGELLTNGEVYQIWKNELMVLDDDGNELVLPKKEMIPADFYKKGETIKAVIYKVEMLNGSPRIVLSRAAPVFLERMMELEVPEIIDGLITIKKIVREPGERAKIAVESYDDRIDPVGSCVGVKGSRIHGIVRELKNENLDVINYTSNLPLMVSRALSPAKISSVKVDEDKKRISVFLKPDQVSLAIGKGGHNIKLAGKLLGYEIDVFRESEEEDDFDVDLEEFADEIDSWILDELKKLGLDTAKSVLACTDEDLVRRTELEEETVREVKLILQKEFEE